jgi:hypothetical protein
LIAATENTLPRGALPGRAAETSRPGGIPPDQHGGKAGLQTVGRLIADHPAIALPAAFAIGVFLGWLVKRT